MIRELKKEDYYKGFLDLINYFTQEPRHFTYEEFVKTFTNMTNSIIHIPINICDIYFSNENLH